MSEKFEGGVPSQETYGEHIPDELKDWRKMSNQELEDAFLRTPESFQREVYRFLNRTETNLQWFLSEIESGKRP